MSKKYSFAERRQYHSRRSSMGNSQSQAYGSTKYAYSSGWLQGAGYPDRYYPNGGKSVGAFWLGYIRGEKAAKKNRG